MAAHSFLTTLKSLGGARTTVAMAAVKASATRGESEPSEAALWLPLNPFHADPMSPEELLHSLHFLLFPTGFSYKHTETELLKKKKKVFLYATESRKRRCLD